MLAGGDHNLMAQMQPYIARPQPPIRRGGSADRREGTKMKA